MIRLLRETNQNRSAAFPQAPALPNPSFSLSKSNALRRKCAGRSSRMIRVNKYAQAVSAGWD